MKGGKRYGFRFLSHAQAWQAKKYKKTYSQVKKAYAPKTKVVETPFLRLVLKNDCRGC